MTATPLTLYNSLSRSLERFEPIDPARGVRLYSCGPTVYSEPHLGNLRAYVFTDTLSRVLTWKGYDLTHVLNITDVGHLTSDADSGDDKMEAAARARAMSAWDLSRHFADIFRANLRDLNIRTPTHMPLATEYVPAMLEFAKSIADKHCYQLPSGLYFDSTSVPDYGRLAGAQDDAGEGRIDPVEGKRHPRDFAIWRTTPPGETRQMEWESPWGRGAPGWHLECSVMSEALLGQPFDIHTGGIDHREIHHVNEIAQNQAYCGCPDSGARFWMHNNFLVDRGGKMSKSKGGIATLQSLVDRGVHPLAYRLLCLSAHYRSELEFTGEHVLAALTRLKRMVMAVEKLRAKAAGGWQMYSRDAAPTNLHPKLAELRDRFDAAISDDLNTPKALVCLDEAISIKRMVPDEQLLLIQDFDEVLGLNLARSERIGLRVRPSERLIDEAIIETGLKERAAAKADRQFEVADKIRDSLLEAGVEVMDGDPLGWEWKVTL